MSELLPCPHCGGSNVFLRDYDPSNTWIECDDCQIGTLSTLSWPECRDRWNARAALKPSGDAGEVVERLHELHGLLDRRSLWDAATTATDAIATITTLERQLATAREALTDVRARLVGLAWEENTSIIETIDAALTPGVSDAE